MTMRHCALTLVVLAAIAAIVPGTAPTVPPSPVPAMMLVVAAPSEATSRAVPGPTGPEKSTSIDFGRPLRCVRNGARMIC